MPTTYGDVIAAQYAYAIEEPLAAAEVLSDAVDYAADEHGIMGKEAESRFMAALDYDFLSSGQPFDAVQKSVLVALQVRLEDQGRLPQSDA